MMHVSIYTHPVENEPVAEEQLRQRQESRHICTYAYVCTLHMHMHDTYPIYTQPIENEPVVEEPQRQKEASQYVYCIYIYIYIYMYIHTYIYIYAYILLYKDMHEENESVVAELLKSRHYMYIYVCVC